MSKKKYKFKGRINTRSWKRLQQNDRPYIYKFTCQKCKEEKFAQKPTAKVCGDCKKSDIPAKSEFLVRGSELGFENPKPHTYEEQKKMDKKS